MQGRTGRWNNWECEEGHREGKLRLLEGWFRERVKGMLRRQSKRDYVRKKKRKEEVKTVT